MKDLPLVLYLRIYEVMHSKFDKRREISTKEAVIFLGRFNIVYPIRKLVLKEMEYLKLLRWKNRDTIVLEAKPTPTTEKVSQFASQLHCF